MLTLTGQAGQRIVIGHGVVIEVLEVHGDHVCVAIETPPGVQVQKGELFACEADDCEQDSLVPEHVGVH